MGNNVFGLNSAADSELWARINDMAEEAEKAASGTALGINLSFFEPDGGLIQSIDNSNLTAGNLFLAAYRNMADCYFGAFKQLGPIESSLRGIIGAGGVLRKTPLLERLLEKRFGLQLKLSPDSEDVMHGLLRFGRWQMRNCSEILPWNGSQNSPSCNTLP
jgi:hypothetical protein